MAKKIRVLWIASTEPVRSRSLLDPCIRNGHKPVTLAWLRKHAHAPTYRVRWWEGPSEHEGKWHSKTFAGTTAGLRDAKTYALMIAGGATQWEVELVMDARTHGDLGWEYGVVWHFGHYIRENETQQVSEARP